MRELNRQEVENVNGGFGWIGAGIGAATGIGSAIVNNGSIGEIFAAGLLGGLAGFTGNLAASASTGGFFVRSAWGISSVGLGIGASETVSDD